MRGAWRLAITGLAAGLSLAPAAAFAQDAQTATPAPAPDSVGPRELQNFSLSGTVTRQADQPAQTAPEPAAPTPAESRRTIAAKEAARGRNAPTTVADAKPPQALPPKAKRIELAQAPLLTAPVPSPQPTPTAASVSPAAFPQAPESAAGTLAPEHGLLIWPWILAAFVLAGAGAFLLRRNRSAQALAGGPQLDLFVPPEPRPEPSPPPRAPSPPAEAPAALRGVVSTSLRPWIEVAIQPLRCIVTDTSVVVEFELDLFNSGSGPARKIYVEAVVINAGATQDEELTAFFARPAGAGERIEIIPPQQRATFTSQVVVPYENVRPVEMAGRQVFVPLLAFNASYAAGSREGRTSAAFLLGREGTADKLAPFRLDLGPRVFRGLGARPLPGGVRQ